MDNFDYSNLPTNFIIENSLEDCKRELFHQFGDEYQIISWRTICKPGFLGLFQKEFVEAKYIIKKRETKINHNDSFEQSKEELLKQLTNSSTSTKQIANLDKKIDLIHSIIQENFSNLKRNSETVHENILRIRELLEENEFTKEYILYIEKQIRSKFSLEELDDFDKVEKCVIDLIGESIVIAKKKAYRPPHIIVLVGPTGVGKSTTIAKIAAQHILTADKENLPRPIIRIVSSDGVRIAADEQIRRYAEVLEIPFDNSNDAEDLKKLYHDYKNSTDLIFVDTSGYSPNDSDSISKLKNHLTIEGVKLDIYLTINASTNAKDLINIIQNFEPLGFNSIIITKCDETIQFGNVISILNEKHKSISFLTYGQSVARDISRASVNYFLKRLNGFKVDRSHIDEKFGE